MEESTSKCSRLILASGSPRRKELLEEAGLAFEIIPSTVDEVVDERLEPLQVAQSLAMQKASDVYARIEKQEICDEIIALGADTIVVCDGHILGKPRSKAEATRMLANLSGRTHQVITGVALVSSYNTSTFAEVSHVTFRKLEEEEIEAYVASGEPMDKAGAYGIQGGAAAFVSNLEGDYRNVVGLPLDRVLEELSALASTAE